MQQLPEVKIDEAIQDSGGPAGLQQSAENLASTGNIYTEIGSASAQAAHSQLAQMQGTMAGKNPGGKWDTARAMFDPDFAESYNAQAAATLSLHANKLLLDSSVALSKDPNLNAATIANAHSQVAQGMQGIFQNAPAAVKGKLESEYQNQLQTQTAKFQAKMFEQQRDNQKQTGEAFLNQAAKNAFNISMAGSAQSTKASEDVLANAKKVADNLVANRLMDRAQADNAIDSIKQSSVQGKYVSQGVQAYNDKKLEPFLADLASGKVAPEVLPADRIKLISAVTSYVGQIQNLNNQQQTLTMTKFEEKLALDPSLISGVDLQNTMSSLSPLNAEKVQLAYIKAVQKHRSNQPNVASFTDAGSFSSLTKEQKNNNYYSLVKAQMQSAADQGQNMSQAEAEVRVASQAGGEVPAFTSGIEGKLLNGTSNQMLEASNQYRIMTDRGYGNKVQISDKARAAEITFRKALNHMPIEDARVAAIKQTSALSPEEEQAVSNQWAKESKRLTSGNITQSQAGLALVNGITGNQSIFTRGSWPLSNPSVYGQEVFNRYRGYFAVANGNADTAKEMVQQDINNSFGHTQINGRKETTLYPVEGMLGLPENSAPVIIDDVQQTLQDKLKHSKEVFDKGVSDSYWEVKPRMTLDERQKLVEQIKNRPSIASELLHGKGFKEAFHGRNLLSDPIQSESELPNEPLKVVRHFRDGKVQEYDVEIQSSPSFSQTVDPNHPYIGGWDIGIKTSVGVKPLVMEDPWDDVATYQPNAQKLKSQYLKYYPSGQPTASSLLMNAYQLKQVGDVLQGSVQNALSNATGSQK